MVTFTFWDAILPMIYVVVGTTFLTYMFNAYALSKLKASTVSSFVYLQPIVGIIYAITTDNDSLTVLSVLGMILIFMGVYFVTKNQRLKFKFFLFLNYEKYFVEFVGTLFLILIIGLTSNPVAIGFGLTVLVYMGAHILGAHYNPVVSLAFIIKKDINRKDFIFYVLSQITGATIGALLIYF